MAVQGDRQETREAHLVFHRGCTLILNRPRGPPMVHTLGRTAVAQGQSLLRGFLQEGSCPFSPVLTVKDIVDLLCQECVETADRIFPPVVTLWTFVRHIHSDDPSCRAAVARLNATRVAQGLAPCSPLTGGYGTARQRRPETRLSRLVPLSGQRLQPQ